ncbi:MAG TPA: hypothetical protein VD864_09915, partial [Nocardioides sp.]|nr:hypothetical protein [Nocardioides sp.]
AYVAALAATVLTLGLGACSGDDDEPDEPGAAPSTPAASEPPAAVEQVVDLGRVTGTLPREARDRVVRQVGAVVNGWAAAAYLEGDYPRRDFSDSWPGFTPGAKEEAHRDRALMSNEDIGERIDGVVLRRSRVLLDVLAVRKRAAGVTARVQLGFRTTGDLERVVRVEGRLYLTHTPRGWRVFGYDMTKGAA